MQMMRNIIFVALLYQWLELLEAQLEFFKNDTLKHKSPMTFSDFFYSK